MDELKFCSIIVLPICLVWIITYFLYKIRHEDRLEWSYKTYISKFDEEHGLASQPLFWATITYPIGLFFSTGVWAWSNYSLDISSEGFITFIELSKLPLGLLSLSIPLAVLTARLHGTKQTALQISKTQKQIEETEKKNNIDLYLAHYKHFCEYTSEIETFWGFKKFDIKKIKLTINNKVSYRKLYPQSSLSTGIGQFSIDEAKCIFDELTSIVTSSLRLIESSNRRKIDFRNLFIQSSHFLFLALSRLGLNNKFEDFFSPVSFPLPDSETCYIANFEEMLDAVSYVAFLTSDIYKFDSCYPCLETDLEFAKLALKSKLNDDLVKEAITYLNRTGDGIIPTSDLDWSELLEVNNNGDKLAATI